MPRRFTSTTFFIWGCLLIWMTNFMFVYVFVALACAQQFAGARLFGIPAIPLTTTLSSVAAAFATAVLMWTALRRMRREPDADRHSSFIRFVVIATGVLALIGVVWLTLPPLLLDDPCAGGA